MYLGETEAFSEKIREWILDVKITRHINLINVSDEKWNMFQ